MTDKPSRPLARRAECAVVESSPGIFRTTMAYDEQSMLCHFRLKAGAKIPMHAHAAAQNGYMIRGKMRMLLEGEGSFEALPGTGWCFASQQRHGAEVLEDSEVIECFVPLRPEYI